MLLEQMKPKEKKATNDRDSKVPDPLDAESIFHGKQMLDYQVLLLHPSLSFILLSLLYFAAIAWILLDDR